MSERDWKDMTGVERAAHARSFRRTKILPPMGEQPVQVAARQSRPPETPNPMLGASEPFSFPVERRPAPEYSEFDPRPVVEAEIEELMAWGLLRYQQLWPRATYDSLKPMLIMACRGGRARFLRTDNAVALFIAETTPWEPELYVWTPIIVSRVHVPKEVHRLLRAGKRWAEQIGAVGFEWGTAPREVLERMRPDTQVIRYIKILRKPVEEPTEIAPGARMAAMGMSSA